jgi:hypothetical protein
MKPVQLQARAPPIRLGWRMNLEAATKEVHGEKNMCKSPWVRFTCCQARFSTHCHGNRHPRHIKSQHVSGLHNTSYSTQWQLKCNSMATQVQLNRNTIAGSTQSQLNLSSLPADIKESLISSRTALVPSTRTILVLATTTATLMSSTACVSSQAKHAW